MPICCVALNSLTHRQCIEDEPPGDADRAQQPPQRVLDVLGHVGEGAALRERREVPLLRDVIVFVIIVIIVAVVVVVVDVVV